MKVASSKLLESITQGNIDSNDFLKKSTAASVANGTRLTY